MHNVRILSGQEGEIIVARASKARYMKPSDYLPCTSCYGFFRRTEVTRHYKQCQHKSDNTGSSKNYNVRVESELLLESAVLPTKSGDEVFLEPILSKMNKDDLFYEQITNDPLILRFGKILLNKLGLRRKNNIAQRMRQIGRLKERIGIQSIQDAIKGSSFDAVVEATYSLCDRHTSDDDITVFAKPGLALRTGHNLKKLAQIKIGQLLRSEDIQGQKETENFQRLLKYEWTDKVSSVALATLATNKFNKPQLLPCTEDLTKLTAYVDQEISRLSTLLDHDDSMCCDQIWRNLCEVLLVKVVLFNKRRGGEAESMRMESYENRQQKGETIINKELLDTFSELEKQLVKRLV